MGVVLQMWHNQIWLSYWESHKFIPSHGFGWAEKKAINFKNVKNQHDESGSAKAVT